MARGMAWRCGFVFIALAMGLLRGGAAWAQPGVVFGPPHVARAPAARLDAAARARVMTALAGARIVGVPDAIAFALEDSGRAMHFGLAHRTSLAFGATEREGNCVEYAHYFARVFELAARRGRLRARARVVHSRATVFGRRLPWRGLATHDWVLVEESRTGRRWYVDPSFHDSALGWDIADRVQGPLASARTAP